MKKKRKYCSLLSANVCPKKAKGSKFVMMFCTIMAAHNSFNGSFMVSLITPVGFCQYEQG